MYIYGVVYYYYLIYTNDVTVYLCIYRCIYTLLIWKYIRDITPAYNKDMDQGLFIQALIL